MNEITIDHVNHLIPDQLSKLLLILLKNEVKKNELKSFNITVPLKINIADGGEDGRIEWVGNLVTNEYLKNKVTIFQNKATNLQPAECMEEILEPAMPRQPRKLKSQVEDVVLKNGCYTLFINQSLTSTKINSRISKFREAIKLANHKNYSSFEIYIYDANIIKEWVNEYVAAVTFVQSCNGINRPFAFRTWKEWEIDLPDSHVTFQTNDILTGYMDQIRVGLVREKVIRIIGQSGLGKSRMILETYRENATLPEIKAQQSQLVYYDIGTGIPDKIISYILSHRGHQSGIIVIDNCNEELHLKIANLVRASGNFLLITIDFSSETNEQTVIKLDRNSQKDIVRKMVDEEFNNTLSMTDREYISNQSEGYPQMAILFSKLVKAKGLERLNNELPEYYLKKLIFGRNQENEIDFEVIKACSVVSSFGFVDNNYLAALTEEEKSILRKQNEYVRNRICGEIQGRFLTHKEFNQKLIKFKKTNLIEQRGSRLMVKPTPLAINLAARWWMETDTEDIIQILTELKDDDLGKRIVERLSELDQLNKAKEIVNELWGANSPFGTAEVLNTSLGSQLFRYVVNVNPEATLNTLMFSFGNLSKVDLKRIYDGRRDIVRALERLCFRKETFIESAKILYSFAVSENENWRNNATYQFLQLFQLYLPGTEASLMERLEVIEWGLNKEDDDYTRIAILALEKGLENDRFMRVGGSEYQGSGAPLIDYNPRWKEINEYWHQILAILTRLASSNSIHAELASEKIAQSVRVLARGGLFDIVAKSIRLIASTKANLWTEVLKNLKITVSSEPKLPSETIEQINLLIAELTPSDIRTELYLKVSKPEWEKYEKRLDGNYIDFPKLNAELFAEKIVKDKISLMDYLPDLLNGEQRQGFNFGKKIGELTNNQNLLIDAALQRLKEVPKENQNPELIGGLLIGTADRKLFRQTIDQVITDNDLSNHSFYLTRISNPTLIEIEKLFILIDKYGFSIDQFLHFQYGRALDNLKNKEVIQLCNKIGEYGNIGKWTALSIMYMFCLGNEEKWKQNIDFFKSIIISESLIIKKENSIKTDNYYWTETVFRILNEYDQKDFAITIIKQVLAFCSQSDLFNSFQGSLTNIVHLILDKFFDEIWEYLAEGIIGDYHTYLNLIQIIGSRNGIFASGSPHLFRGEDQNKIILDWCRYHPDIAPERIAQIMPLSISENKKIKWHPFAMEIIDKFGDKKNVLGQLSANFGTFGITGSVIPYYIAQKELLKQLANHKIEAIRKWANHEIAYLEIEIQREQLRNDEHS